MSTLQFDGVDYQDGIASDPNTLGWMQGSPPAPDKRIRFADDRFFGFPQIRWTLSHMRELVPTASVWRGSSAASALGAPSGGDGAAIDTLEFVDLQGRRRQWAQALPDVYTDGIVVLHRGRLVYERYFGALQAHMLHNCFSITKSVAATLAATLVHEGVLDEDQTIAHYLPEMAASAYADATLRQVMDMQIGLQYSELYSDPQAAFWDYARAAGLRSQPHGYAGPTSIHAFLVGLQKEGAHGAAFAYKTVNTEVMCWLLQRVAGVQLSALLSQRIWSLMGCEEDACFTVDPVGTAMGGAGLCTSLRDMARFGELMRNEGARGSQQLVPSAVVADIRRGADPAKFAKAGYGLLGGYSYRNMWWVTHNEHAAFEGRGIHGQRLYVAPGAEMVVARFASHPIAASAANDPITMPALQALGRMLKGA
ncbi:MAG: beta-lactamase family protein [Rhodoferax sp.]|nr:beta-lactamase family protein [Rhodoferax sp.]